MITLRHLINNITAQTHIRTISQLCTALVKHAEIIDIPFNQFALDSRTLNQDDVFILLKSQTQPVEKSREYVKIARQKAAFIISEIPLADLDRTRLDSDLNSLQSAIIEFPAIRSILGTLIQHSLMLQAFDCNPKKEVNGSKSFTSLKPLPKVVAVTGTNGKTTITQLLAQLCQSSERITAVMGTAGNGRLGHLTQASHTTGDALAIQTFLRQMANESVDILALEASSHGLDQQRLQGVPIEVAIYTNLSRDHLDYHLDMQDYAAAKARLFKRAYFPSLTHAIINIDDDFAPLMLQSATESGLVVWTYSIDANKVATFKVAQIKPSLEGVEMALISDFGTVWLNSPLLGRFNVANLLAAIAGAMAIGIPLSDMPSLVRQLKGADGRMQRVIANNTQAANEARGCFIVDYAHTPAALTQVLTSLRQHCEGELWAVFGCGGDRDRGKRKLMAQAGLDYADNVVLTSDNPRHEDPLQILADMSTALTKNENTQTIAMPKVKTKTWVIADRHAAIEYAVSHAHKDDIVVIAGKGHETYQEIKGVRHDFDDRVVLQQLLNQSDVNG